MHVQSQVDSLFEEIWRQISQHIVGVHALELFEFEVKRNHGLDAIIASGVIHDLHGHVVVVDGPSKAEGFVLSLCALKHIAVRVDEAEDAVEATTIHQPHALLGLAGFRHHMLVLA